MTKAQDLADKIDLHLQVNSPGFHLSDDDMRLIAASLRGGELPQSPADAWRWRYEGCKGWVYTDNEPAFFPDEEKLKPEVQMLRASAHSRPDREGK